MKKNGEETVTPIKNMKIIQRNDFQNFTLDSVLLADFVKINRKTKKILDIGTGCGIITLLLAQRSKAQITGIELQKIIAEIAIRNINSNKFENQVKIINEDIKNYKDIFNRDEFDTIVTNPPYFEFTGDISQTNNLEQLANARHNINLTLEEIIKIFTDLDKQNDEISIYIILLISYELSLPEYSSAGFGELFEYEVRASEEQMRVFLEAVNYED